MAELPTPAELATAAGIAFRTAIDPGGTGAVDLAPGSRNDVAVSVVSATAYRLTRYVADRVTAGRAATATDDDLDTYALDNYGERRKAEAFATGFLRLTRGGSSPTYVPQGSRFGVPATATQPAVVFEATADTPSSSTSVVVPVVAVASGPGSNIPGPAAVTAILDALPDTTWVLDTAYAPATPFGGGADAESDDTFRKRLAQISPQAERQRGTRDALLAGALRVPGVAFVTPVEPQDGTVRVFVGDSDYNLPAVLKQAVEQELRAWRAFGVPALVLPYAVSTVAVVGSIYMSRALANYDQSAIVADAVQRVLDYFQGRPQPDEYYLDAITAAIHKASPEGQHVVLTSPVADVVRPPDSGYGVVTALNRYRADRSSVALTILPPLTT